MRGAGRVYRPEAWEDETRTACSSQLGDAGRSRGSCGQYAQQDALPLGCTTTSATLSAIFKSLVPSGALAPGFKGASRDPATTV
jgi:hypothetical protein